MKAQIVQNELVLHGPVGINFWDEDGIFAADVRTALSEIDGDTLTVRLNSGGGVATEGAAVHAVLAGFDGDVEIYVEGVAASAASLIAMAGSSIVMTEASLMMIHDPSGITIGNAEAHRDTASVLDTIADTYAKVYAGKTGRTQGEMREMMKEEVWLDAEAALERGFATHVAEHTDNAMAVSPFAYHEAYTAAPERLVAMAREKGWTADKRPYAAESAKLSGGRAAPDTKEEASMPTETQAAPEAAKTEAEPAEMDQKTKDIVAADERRKTVMAFVGPELSGEEVEKIVAETNDPAEAKMAAADIVAQKRINDEPSQTRLHAQVTDDEDGRKIEAMVGALRNRLFGAKLEGAAQQYRGLSVKKLAMELGGGASLSRSDTEIVKAGMSARGVIMAAGMHSTSDFTYLMAETMNRQLRAEYESRPGTWRRISRERSASDFRTLYSVQSGADVEMKKVNEAGEYESTVIVDGAESFAVQRYGREAHLTFEAVVNDDLGAFARLPGAFARGALNLESRIAWGLINANGNMSDGAAFFANTAARGRNLAASGTAITPTAVANGRKVMWEQRPMGAKSTGDDFISAEPNLIYVPPALEYAVLQFVAQTTPETDGNTNPFKSTLEPMVEARLGAQVTGGSDTSWYLFDESLPAMEHAFLDGFDGPMVDTEENMNPKGVTFTAEHIFGAGLVEFRGAYKNSGA